MTSQCALMSTDLSNMIQEFESQSLAAKFLNRSYSCINSAIKHNSIVNKAYRIVKIENGKPQIKPINTRERFAADLAKPKQHFVSRPVQIYDIDYKLQKSYINVKDVLKSTDHEMATKSGIMNAIKYKTVYLGYRWFSIGKTDNPYVPQDIGPTLERYIPTSKGEPIAMLTPDKKEIVQVFRNQSDIVDATGQKSSYVCDAIRFQMPMSLHYWKYLNNIDESIVNVWIAKHGEIKFESKKR